MHRQIAGALTGRVTKWVVLIFWVLALGVAGPLGAKLTEVQSNESKEWLPGDAESTQVLEQQTSFSDPDIAPAIVVYEQTAGFSEAEIAKVQSDAAAFADIEGVAAEATALPLSEDGQVLQVIVPMDLGGSDGWENAPAIADEVREIAGADADLTVHITGPGGMAADSAEAFEGMDTNLLLGTVAVVIVILLFTYRSPVLWLLPVLSAGAALGAAQGVIYLLAKHAGLTVNAQSAGILTVLVFGAGTDYALLLVARYREELRRHEDRHEAMAVALHRAGPAIVASGATVVVGMLCLLAADMNSTKGLGPVAAIGIAVGLLAMLTLLPALLVIFGRWIFWPKRPLAGSAEPTESGLWSKVGRGIAHRPRTVWITTAAILGVAWLGLLQLNATGLSTEASYTNTVDSVRGEEVLQKHGLSDSGSPVAVIASPDQADAAAEVIGNTEGIAQVQDPAVQGDTAYLEAALTDSPDSEAAFDTIERLRAELDEVGDDVLVGGMTAVTQDIRDASNRDNLVIIPIVLIVVFLILVVLLRAVIAPLLLVATVVLSFGAALGVSGLVFQHLFGFEGADNAFPLFVFVFLVALGIDYNIFLMTRVREEALKHGTRLGALIGLSATGGVITSAGIVLAGTFAVLGSLPLVFLAELGFAVAFGVLLDTIVVRAVLVTALNLDIGRHIWWPSALGRKEDVSAEEAAASDQVLVGG